MVDSAKANLVIQGGPNSGMTIPLSGNALTLGRRPDNDVVVDETTVSRRHALIIETPAGFVLRDLSTTNGTYVNRNKLGSGEHVLKQGDRIRLAGSEVTFTFRQESPRTVTMTTDPPVTGQIKLGDREDRERTDQEKPKPSLDGKDAELLRLLEARRGVVVSREEIARHVWPELPEGSLANDVLDQSVERLRADIEEDPSKPVHLITVGEFGFLLV